MRTIDRDIVGGLYCGKVNMETKYTVNAKCGALKALAGTAKLHVSNLI